MFYKKCDTCKNKICLVTKSICESMDKWLKKNVEVPQRELLFRKGYSVLELHGLWTKDGHELAE